MRGRDRTGQAYSYVEMLIFVFNHWIHFRTLEDDKSCAFSSASSCESENGAIIYGQTSIDLVVFVSSRRWYDFELDAIGPSLTSTINFCSVSVCHYKQFVFHREIQVHQCRSDAIYICRGVGLCWFVLHYGGCIFLTTSNCSSAKTVIENLW